MRITYLLLVALLLPLILGCARTTVRRGQTAPTSQPLDTTRYTYAWTKAVNTADSLTNRIPPPAGSVRVPQARDSFGDWLRHLPLKPGCPPVRLFDGRENGIAGWHVAVVDIDTGTRDLQQCADAVMRLRAEYLFAQGQRDKIVFRYVDGFRADFAHWAQGYRPVARGRSFAWVRRARPDASHAALRAYMNQVFAYASTLSLARDLKPASVDDLRIGDVFVRGGSPGHAEIVVDLAEDPKTKARAFLLVQSFMPAQDMHITRNPTDPTLSPWYRADFGDSLVTPGYTFTRGELKRF